jgi:hypothetical protein
MRHLTLCFKPLLFLALAALLWHTLQSNGGFYPAWIAFQSNQGAANLSWLLAALLLMPLNAILELQKWYPLVRRYENISYFGALRAVWSGATLSIFSPARLGEYGGRVLHISASNRGKALRAHLLGGFAQMVVMVVFGLGGALWCLQNLWVIGGQYWQLCAVLAAVAAPAALLFYLHFQRILPLLLRFPFPKSIKRYVKDFSGFERYEQADLWRVLGWSALRYAVSCCQYFFLLQFFDIETGLIAGFSCISGIFLLQTCVPLPPAVNFFARGNVAVWVWSSFAANEVACVAVSYLLWIINLFLPALLGTFSILHVNIAKTLGYENE